MLVHVREYAIILMRSPRGPVHFARVQCRRGFRCFLNASLCFNETSSRCFAIVYTFGADEPSPCLLVLLSNVAATVGFLCFDFVNNAKSPCISGVPQLGFEVSGLEMVS